jgi:hypothetical protein
MSVSLKRRAESEQERKRRMNAEKQRKFRRRKRLTPTERAFEEVCDRLHALQGAVNDLAIILDLDGADRP